MDRTIDSNKDFMHFSEFFFFFEKLSIVLKKSSFNKFKLFHNIILAQTPELEQGLGCFRSSGAHKPEET